MTYNAIKDEKGREKTMKKWLLLLAASMTLAACGTTPAEDTAESTEVSSTVVTPETETAEISVQVDGEEIEDGRITVELTEGEVLLDIMKANFEIEEANTFITSINGHAQDEGAGKYWLFDLNGEMAPYGAADLELEDGDLVEFYLSES